VRGQVTGADPGDRVKVWFSAKGKKESDAFSYQVRSDSGADVLVLATEDYTGDSAFPPYPGTNGPFYLSYYTDALEANGIEYDVWDYDAEGRNAPDALGVLSHYDAVVWYTGNDRVTRPVPRTGVSDEQMHRTTMAVRDFVNEGGRVAWSGVHAGGQYDATEYAHDGAPFNHCDGNLNTTDGGKCSPLSNDFLQYYLGSYVRSDGGGLNPEGGVFGVLGSPESPLNEFEATLNGPDSAGNQEGGGFGTSTHLVTSSVLPEDTHPQFASSQAADWALEGGAAFDPHSGSWYMYSQNADEGYKRLTRTVDLSAASAGELRFWTSYNTEPGWDHVFVEARTAGGTDWTTLRDENGHTTQDTGASCASGWSEELHNRIRNYTTYDPAGEGSCTPTGTTGEWHAASGNSGGWKEWRIDLTRYAGQQVEVSIVYATDWSTTTVPGVLIDDTTVTVGGTSETTDFEADLGGWSVPGAHPEGPSSNVNDWIRSERIPFEDAAVTQTEFGMLFGFGFEGVDGADNRAELMRRTVEYLLE
jgi:Immune inhibitor A peptidase M6